GNTPISIEEARIVISAAVRVSQNPWLLERMIVEHHLGGNALGWLGGKLRQSGINGLRLFTEELEKGPKAFQNLETISLDFSKLISSLNEADRFANRDIRLRFLRLMNSQPRFKKVWVDRLSGLTSLEDLIYQVEKFLPKEGQ